MTEAIAKKVFVFGVGRCGKVHATTVSQLGHEIVAIGDQSAEAVDDALKYFATIPSMNVNAMQKFSSTQAAADAVKIGRLSLDAVVVATHTPDHSNDASPFISLGIPVYCEKPLTSDLLPAFEFVQNVLPTAPIPETAMQIGLQRRCDPALCWAKYEVLDKGLIGEVREIRSVLRDQHPPPPTYVSRSMIIDMGVHVADEVLWLLGETPTKVWAKAFPTKGYDGAKEHGIGTAWCGFITASGTLGRLDLSRTHSSGYVNETHIIGTSGTITVGHFQGYPGPVNVDVWGTDGKRISDACKTFTMTDIPPPRAEFLPRFQKTFACAFADFFKCIETKTRFPAGAKDALWAQVFVNALHASAERGGADVEVPKDWNNVESLKQFCVEHNLL